MPGSWDDRNSAPPSGRTSGVALVWLFFYLLTIVGAIGSGESRRVSHEYARAEAPVHIDGKPNSAQLAAGLVPAIAQRRD